MSLFQDAFWIRLEECSEDYDVVVVAELTRRARGWDRFGLSQDDFTGFHTGSPDAADVEEERSEAALTKPEAELALSVLTGGWFAEEARAAAPGAPQPPEPRMYLGLELAVDDILMRAFRVDVYPAITLVGEDSTDTFEHALNPNDEGVLHLSGSPSDVAGAAADWLERELGRVIERREWDVRDFCYRRWYLSDTQTALSADGRIFRFVPADLGPPDRIIVAHPPR